MDFITPQKRYRTLNFHLQSIYNTKVFKVSLNGGFTCPNRDGTLDLSGCLFCSEKGSGDFAGNPTEPLKTQFEKVSNRLHEKWPEAKYIAYFQANTNTYGSLKTIKSLFEEAISLHPDIVILSIATRPDCLSDEIVEYLASINARIPLWVELGLQTVNQDSLNFLNVGYTVDDFKNSVTKLRRHNIEVIAHIINGLPNETFTDMLNTAKFLNTQDIQGVKIHSLFIQKNTPLADIFTYKPFKLLSLQEYVDITVKQLSLLNPNFVIHRISGDAPRDELIAPQWSLKKFVVMNEIDKKMRKTNIHQGIYFKNKP